MAVRHRQSGPFKSVDKLTFALSIAAIVISGLAFYEQRHNDTITRNFNRPVLTIGTAYVAPAIKDKEVWHVTTALPVKNIGHSIATVTKWGLAFSPNLHIPIGRPKSEYSGCEMIDATAQQLQFAHLYPDVAKDVILHFDVSTKCAVSTVPYEIQLRIDYTDDITRVPWTSDDPLYVEIIFCVKECDSSTH